MAYQNKPPIDELMHYGVARRSGRYPWGSGDDPYQHSGDFLSRIDELKKQGLSDTEIARTMKLTTTQFRTQKALAKDERRSLEVARAKDLRDKGYSLNEIAKQMGYSNDSSVRSLLNTNSEARMNAAKNTAKFLKEQVDEKGIIDIGPGVERELNVSREKLAQATHMLELEGYHVYNGRVPQQTNPGKFTTLTVLARPEKEHKDMFDYGQIKSVTDYVSYDQGETFKPAFAYPASFDSKRLQIRYAEDGGTQKDGVIELRRGVDDISLGKSHYAQVRILVDGKKYLKGMAVYSDDLPDGCDILFNTNKTKNVAKLDVLKDIKDDPDNPFGALIKEHGGQSYYIDKDGKEKLSVINKTREEGDWNEWSKELPSQFLSKQSKDLIKKQLDLAIADKQAEFDDINSLTIPTVKKAMLKTFADDCDAAAVHLKAAALPRQKYQVILPVPDLKETEVYAPNYHDGEKIALIRYPHGGTFEIPILTVNNKHAGARKLMGPQALDAVGINSKVAERLSGADFDGDTVMAIPTRGNGKNLKVNIISKDPLEGLKDFDPKMSYPERPGMTYMKYKKDGKTVDKTQIEMGKISNLITDMTLIGATDDELAKAVRHSMVVIDAGKHKLDYKQSEIDNDIATLKRKYQGHIGADGKYHEGSGTLISRAKSPVQVNKRKGNPIIDPETGEQSYKEVIEEYVDKNGKVQIRTQASTKMAETRDARTLSSGTPKEEMYADYANKLKALANQSRKEMLATGNIKYSKTAKETYATEVNSLNAKLNVVLKNTPRERHAQTVAAAEVKAKRESNPDLTKDEIKKLKQQALSKARARLGAKSHKIELNDREWEAIQAGAISENKLSQIISKVDADELRERATPRVKQTVTAGKKSKIKSMANSGYTISEIAKAVGLSTSMVSKELKG